MVWRYEKNSLNAAHINAKTTTAKVRGIAWLLNVICHWHYQRRLK
jgi:hypothetical protein